MIPGEPERGFEVVEQRLAEERPLPAPGFRAELRRGLIAEGAPRRAPEGLRLLIAAYVVAGLALLSIVAFGLADIGPLDSQTNPALEAQPTSSATDSPSSSPRSRRSERERICCTLASVSPVSSAISGPESSPP